MGRQPFALQFVWTPFTSSTGELRGKGGHGKALASDRSCPDDTVQVWTNCGRRLQSSEGLSLRFKNSLYFLVKSTSPEPRGLQVLNVSFQVRNVPLALRDRTRRVLGDGHDEYLCGVTQCVTEQLSSRSVQLSSAFKPLRRRRYCAARTIKLKPMAPGASS
jgi:hypothetical protein